MQVLAKRLVRKMRGGSQAHLLEATDGDFYVVKFLGNPQHSRILVNEVLSTVILQHLQVAAPDIAFVEVTQSFLDQNSDVCFSMRGNRVAVEPGWHFGSRYPGNPAYTPVYDFMPDVLLSRVRNMPDFVGCLVFDKWAGNADGRQSIFMRAPSVDRLSERQTHNQDDGFIALMIDHGFAFNGPYWNFLDAPSFGLYMRRMVYDVVTGMSSFEPWLDRVAKFPDAILDITLGQIPPSWVKAEGERIAPMLEKLMRRRERVADLLEELRYSHANPFHNWP